MIELRHNELLLRGYPAAKVEWSPNTSITEQGAIAEVLGALDEEAIERRIHNEVYDDAWSDGRFAGEEAGKIEGRAEVLEQLGDYFNDSDLGERTRQKILKLLEEFK